MDPSPVAGIIRDAMHKLDLSAREVSRRSGISNATVSGILRGRVVTPERETLEALAPVLKLSARRLVEAVHPRDGHPPWTPPAHSKYLTPGQRQTLERLIADLVRGNGKEPGPSR